jgi:hypothetical protein
MMADFDDQDAVLAEVAKALDIDPDDSSIEEDRGLTGFGAGLVYRIESGQREYMVVENDDQARELALEIAKQDLEQEPGIFNKSFIESHIDTEKLAQALYGDVHSERYDYYSELDADDFWREADGYGMDVPEEDEDGGQRDPTGGEINDLATRAAEDLLKDPMEYLEDIYGRDDVVEQAIKIVGIDIDAAAEEAVQVDGAAHFLRTYDGNTYETARGLVYWRHN